MRPLSLTALVLISVVLAFAQQPNTGEPVEMEVVDEIVFDTCTGENVLLNGSVRVQSKEWQGGDGAFHFQLSEKIDLRGIGEISGNDYLLISMGTVKQFVAEGGLPAKFSMTVKQNLLGAGPLLNEKMHMVLHDIISASGHQISISRFQFDCSGNDTD